MNARADESIQKDTPSSLAVATAFLLIYLSWGTTYKATGYAMQELLMPPALFGGTRLLLAGSILLTYQFARGQSLSMTRVDFARLLPISICLFPMGNLFINLGQQKVPSGVAAILIATTPLWIGFLGVLWPGGERLFWRGWAGLVLGFAGILLALGPEVQDGFNFTEDFRFLLVLASAASWALGSLFSRHLAPELAHLTSAGYQMILGGVFQVAIGTGFGEWPDFITRFNAAALGAYLYLLIIGSLTGFIAFNWLLGHVSAAKVGTYAYVNPVIAVFIGMITDEPINWQVFVGFAIIMAGVYLVRGDHVPSTREVELEPD